MSVIESIKTECDLTPERARELRTSLGMSQSEFWGVAGVSKAVGSAVERRDSVPTAYRRLVFLAHVCGLNVDGSTEQGAANLRALAALQGDTAQLVRMESTRARLAEARRKIDAAIKALDEVAAK